MRYFFLTTLFIFNLTALKAQVNYAYKTFDDTRVVNGHSVETNTEGYLKFIIAHRFGALNDGSYNFWGLDDANIRFGLDYGITNKLTIGLGRSSFEKTFDGFVKYRLLSQSSGDRVMPVTVSFLGATALKTLKSSSETELLNKLSMTSQLLIARQWGPRLSLQVMPTYLHRNLVENDEENDLLSLGIAGQFQLLRSLSVSAEYYLTPKSNLPDGSGLSPESFHSLAVGFQIETRGHVFQLHFGNSRGMIEKFFVAETTGSWLDGGIHFGFNISRNFKIKGRRIRG